jgi:hypothetical protein
VGYRGGEGGECGRNEKERKKERKKRNYFKWQNTFKLERECITVKEQG